MFQKVIIAGNLGRDPDLRYTSGGQSVASFSVATNRRWTGQDGNQQEETVWFRVSVWGKQAETCKQYLSKGRQVLVEGRLTADRETGGPRLWTDQSGVQRASYELTATSVHFLGGRNGGGGQGYPDQGFPEQGQGRDFNQGGGYDSGLGPDDAGGPGPHYQGEDRGGSSSETVSPF